MHTLPVLGLCWACAGALQGESAASEVEDQSMAAWLCATALAATLIKSSLEQRPAGCTAPPHAMSQHFEVMHVPCTADCIV